MEASSRSRQAFFATYRDKHNRSVNSRRRATPLTMLIRRAMATRCTLMPQLALQPVRSHSSSPRGFVAMGWSHHESGPPDVQSLLVSPRPLPPPPIALCVVRRGSRRARTSRRCSSRRTRSAARCAAVVAFMEQPASSPSRSRRPSLSPNARSMNIAFCTRATPFPPCRAS